MSKAGPVRMGKRVLEILFLVSVVACSVAVFRHRTQPKTMDKNTLERRAAATVDELSESSANVVRLLPRMLAEGVKASTQTESARLNGALLALNRLDATLENDPDNFGARVERARTYLTLENKEAALEDLDHALQLQPESTVCLRWRSSILSDFDLDEEAISDLDKLLSIAPDEYPMAFNNRAYSKAKLGRYTEALEDAENALSALPDSEYVWDTLGYIYVGLGRFDEAVEAYEQVLERKPFSIYALRGKAVAHRALGELDKSEELLERQRNLDPYYCLHWEYTEIDQHDEDRKYVLVSDVAAQRRAAKK